MACLSLILPYPFDGQPLKVGMVSWVSRKNWHKFKYHIACKNLDSCFRVNFNNMGQEAFM
jgi:hypothetical protein